MSFVSRAKAILCWGVYERLGVGFATRWVLHTRTLAGTRSESIYRWMRAHGVIGRAWIRAREAGDVRVVRVRIAPAGDR